MKNTRTFFYQLLVGEPPEDLGTLYIEPEEGILKMTRQLSQVLTADVRAVTWVADVVSSVIDAHYLPPAPPSGGDEDSWPSPAGT